MSTTSRSSRFRLCGATTWCSARRTSGGTKGLRSSTHLESVYIGSDENLIDPRFPVQYVIRSQMGEGPDFRGYAGTVASGVLRPGDEVLVLPSGMVSHIDSIATADGALSEAFPHMAVVITLDGRHCRVARRRAVPAEQPALHRHGARVHSCWMDERSPLTIGRTYLLKHNTRTVRAAVNTLHYRLEVNGLRRDETAEDPGAERNRPRHLQLHRASLRR